MKAWLAALMVVASTVWADTTPNLITNTPGFSGTGVWIGWGGYSQLNGQQPTSLWGCCASYSGSAPFFDTSTSGSNGQSGQFHWSYGQAVVQQIIAVNQALSGSGIQINGYNWGYEVRNMNGGGGQNGVDQLTAVTFLRHTNGTWLLSDTQVYRTSQEWNWHGGTVTAATPYALADVGTLGIQFTAQDSGYWAGYYGPQVRNVDLSLNYTAAPVDPCSVDPLSSPSCPGYATAYHDQQCAINTLYASTCPGYQQAYYQQQCSINPLYDSTCPGYQAAYYNQQCTSDPLYDTGCPGYQQAYYDQQCANNPLYDSGCANYDIVSAATQPPAQEDTATVIAQADTTAISSSSASEPTAATSATSPTSVSPAAVVSTVKPSAPAAAPAPSTRAQSAENARQETRAAEQKSEQKKTDRAVARAVPKGAKGQAAQRAAEEKAEEAVADAAAATTIEAQQAAQSLVLGLMGYNPAFSAYQNAIVPDTNAAVMARQYNQPTVDNRRALRALSGASDRVHQDMVDQQYGRMP
jgi:hypothetical protein